MIVRLNKNPFAKGSPQILEGTRPLRITSRPATEVDLHAAGIRIERVRESQAAIARGDYVTLEEFAAGMTEAERSVSFEELPRAVQNDIAEILQEKIPALSDMHPDAVRDALSDSLPPSTVILSHMKPVDLRGKFKDRTTSNTAVKALQSKVEAGLELDPVVVAGDKFIDGGHRVQAYVNAKRDSIPVVDIARLLKRDWKRWLNGEVNEEQLDETVAQVRKYLDGKNQVLDLGTIGLFHVYSVRPVSGDTALSHLQYVVSQPKGMKPSNYGRTAEVEAWLKQIHTLPEYRKAVDADAMNAPYALDPTVANLAQITANVKEASDAILSTGVRRQSDVLILLDLSQKKNRITGGGLGGTAYRQTHAIEADLAEMSKPFGVELLVHEWGHKFFFALPQHVTNYVRDWFKTNIEGDKRITDAPLLDERQRGFALDRAWDGFRKFWMSARGVAPDEYLKLRERAKSTTRGDPSPYFDVFLDRGRMIVGKLTKSIPNAFPDSDGERSVRKGATVWAISSAAVHPGSYVVIPLVKGVPKSTDKQVYTTPDVLRASMEIDLKASAEKSEMDLDALRFRIERLQSPDQTEKDNFFVGENTVYSALDDAIRGAVNWIASRKITVSFADLFPLDNHYAFAADWIEQASHDGDKFDAERTFRALFNKYADWDLASRQKRSVTSELSAPEGQRMRDLAAKLNITPSSYAASNVDELMAELMAFTALKPESVPKPLRALLRNVMQGNTPGKGQRVRVERKPYISGKWPTNEGIDEAMSQGFSVPSDYVLLRVTSHRQRDKLTAAFGEDGLTLMAWKPGQSFLSDRVEAMAVPATLAAKMGSESYPWYRLKAPKLGKSYLVRPWTFSAGDRDDIGWLTSRGFKRNVVESLDEQSKRPTNPDAYHRAVGRCPDGYHFDPDTKRCEKNDSKEEPGLHVHVHLPGKDKPKEKPKPAAPSAPATHAADGRPISPSALPSKHPNLRKALGHTWHTISHPFHAAWDLVRKPEARKKLRDHLSKSIRKEGSETKALLGTIGKAIKGQSITPAERTAAIAQTADLVKTAIMTYAVGHIFAGGVVKALATLASPADEVIGIAIDKPLRAITTKVFGSAHGILPTAFYESEQDPESVLMKLFDEILDQLDKEDLEDEDILSALSKSGMTPDVAKRVASKSTGAEEGVRVLMTSNPFLEEGVDDKHVLKAVFLAGGAGSGKGFIGEKAFGDTGLRVVNSDPQFEHLMRKSGLDTKKDVGSDAAQKLRPRAKELTKKKESGLTHGGVGIVIDGTGDDPVKIKQKKTELEALGYDTSMVFVDVPLDVARSRNAQRSRVVPDEVLTATHKASQAAKAEYQKMFGDKFAHVDNGRVLSSEEVRKELVPKLARIALKLIDGPVENEIGRKWIKSQLAPGEKHPGLAEPRRKHKPQPTEKEDVSLNGHEGRFIWRTTKGGKHVRIDTKKNTVQGNPHVTKLMNRKRPMATSESYVLLREDPFA